MTKTDLFIQQANTLGSQKTPFFFLLDFELKKPFICAKTEAASHGFYFDIKGDTNSPEKLYTRKPLELNPEPVSRETYRRAFNLVQRNLKAGNTYLLNLTFPSKLHNVRKLSGIFKASPAPYKLLSTENFVLFSPECFVRISGNHIYSFPMKGTIDAGIPNAEELILQNKKEYFEHNTIVDLIRNDLSVVSHNIAVPRFRFIDRLKTSNKELLQVSSQIRGELPENWHKNIGDILLSLLPAGSVSGAPKAKTIEIIRESEKQDRGFFTGIFGIFNGDSLESGVNIRFIEQTKNGFFFRSGGGITALSTMDEEYEEMINKVYVPLA